MSNNICSPVQPAQKQFVLIIQARRLLPRVAQHVQLLRQTLATSLILMMESLVVVDDHTEDQVALLLAAPVLVASHPPLLSLVLLNLALPSMAVASILIP